MKCKHEERKKLEKYGEEECLSCGANLDTADPKMLNSDGTPKQKAQEEWKK